jgi:hypothetical protein
VDAATVHTVPADRYRTGLGSFVEGLKKLPPYQWLKHHLSPEAKGAIKLRLRLAFGRDRPAQSGGNAGPDVTRDMWHLQTTRCALPTAKFRTTFGHQNPSSFASGLAASLAWLRFTGFEQGTADGLRRKEAP